LIKVTGPLILKTVSDWPFTEKSSEAHFSTEKFGSSGVEPIKLFSSSLIENKLECLLLASLSSLVKRLWVRPGAYPRVEHLKGDRSIK
jgi:hypothetical protein